MIKITKYDIRRTIISELSRLHEQYADGDTGNKEYFGSSVAENLKKEIKQKIKDKVSYMIKQDAESIVDHIDPPGPNETYVREIMKKGGIADQVGDCAADIFVNSFAGIAARMPGDVVRRYKRGVERFIRKLVDD